MKRKRYSEAQISFALQQAESGTPVEEAFRGSGCQRDAAAEAAGRGEPEAQGVGGRSVAGQGHVAGCSGKKALKPVRLSALVEYLRLAYDVSERRGCSVMRFPRSTHRYTSAADGQEQLRSRIRELSFSRPHYGYRRIHVTCPQKSVHL